jgi:hypothetical protein
MYVDHLNACRQCWGSVIFWCGSGPLKMDPDPTPFFIDAKEAKSKKNFVIFFSYNLPKGTSSSAQKFNFLTEDVVLKTLNCILQALFQSAPHIYEKREGTESVSVPLTNGSGSGRNMRIRIRIPNTACLSKLFPLS